MAAPAERADTTATSLGRQALVRSRSLGWCLPGRWPRRRADSSQPRHQASENSGQTRPTATTGIIAVKTSTVDPSPSATRTLACGPCPLAANLRVQLRDSCGDPSSDRVALLTKLAANARQEGVSYYTLSVSAAPCSGSRKRLANAC
jgi:hypothetical protein